MIQQRKLKSPDAPAKGPNAALITMARKLAAAGRSDAEIGRELGVCPDKVYHWVTDRYSYWHGYHRERYETDPVYVEVCRTRAREHSAKRREPPAMAEHNGFDAHRVLRARILGAQRPRKNWLGGMFADLAIPPVAMIVPEKHSPPVGKTEGE